MASDPFLRAADRLADPRHLHNVSEANIMQIGYHVDAILHTLTITHLIRNPPTDLVYSVLPFLLGYRQFNLFDTRTRSLGQCMAELQATSTSSRVFFRYFTPRITSSITCEWIKCPLLSDSTWLFDLPTMPLSNMFLHSLPRTRPMAALLPCRRLAYDVNMLNWRFPKENLANALTMWFDGTCIRPSCALFLRA